LLDGGLDTMMVLLISGGSVAALTFLAALLRRVFPELGDALLEVLTTVLAVFRGGSGWSASGAKADADDRAVVSLANLSSVVDALRGPPRQGSQLPRDAVGKDTSPGTVTTTPVPLSAGSTPRPSAPPSASVARPRSRNSQKNNHLGNIPSAPMPQPAVNQSTTATQAPAVTPDSKGRTAALGCTSTQCALPSSSQPKK
jgi:hypothetical protein